VSTIKKIQKVGLSLIHSPEITGFVKMRTKIQGEENILQSVPTSNFIKFDHPLDLFLRFEF